MCNSWVQIQNCSIINLFTLFLKITLTSQYWSMDCVIEVCFRTSLGLNWILLKCTDVFPSGRRLIDAIITLFIFTKDNLQFSSIYSVVCFLSITKCPKCCLSNVHTYISVACCRIKYLVCSSLARHDPAMDLPYFVLCSLGHAANYQLCNSGIQPRCISLYLKV